MEHKEFNKRKAVYDKLHKYDYLAKDNDFIEITEWTNGEGITVSIFKGEINQTMELSYGELDAIDYLCKCLQYEKF